MEKKNCREDCTTPLRHESAKDAVHGSLALAAVFRTRPIALLSCPREITAEGIGLLAICLYRTGERKSQIECKVQGSPV